MQHPRRGRKAQRRPASRRESPAPPHPGRARRSSAHRPEGRSLGLNPPEPGQIVQSRVRPDANAQRKRWLPRRRVNLRYACNIAEPRPNACIDPTHSRRPTRCPIPASAILAHLHLLFCLGLRHRRPAGLAATAPSQLLRRSGPATPAAHHRGRSRRASSTTATA